MGMELDKTFNSRYQGKEQYLTYLNYAPVKNLATFCILKIVKNHIIVKYG